MVQEVTLAGMLGPEYEDTAFLRNVGNYTASQSNSNIAPENLSAKGQIYERVITQLITERSSTSKRTPVKGSETHGSIK